MNTCNGRHMVTVERCEECNDVIDGDTYYWNNYVFCSKACRDDWKNRYFNQR